MSTFVRFLPIVIFFVRKLTAPWVLYRNLLIKSITNSCAVSFDVCQIFLDHVFSVRKLATRSILYRDLLIKLTMYSSSGISEFCEIFRDHKNFG